jgi:tungstate transport system substrate-binding protein
MLHRNLTAILLSAALVAVAIAAACGDDSSSTKSATTTGSPAAAQPSPTAKPTMIGGSMILATTTSTQDSGLLDVLVPKFKELTGIDVKVIAVGTGAALEMGAKGDADAVLVHAPASEKKYVDNADIVEGKLVMHNDFILVGPPSDPAKVKGLKDLNAAMQAIAAVGPFISRGDASGTNPKELELWKTAGIDPKNVKNREETGQGMGATLNVADQRSGYTLTDRATYLAQKKNLKLDIVFELAKPLLNIYHVYLVNPAKHSGVKEIQGRAFVAFMVAPETQALIASFGKDQFGQALFIADAGKAEDAVGQ